MIQDQALVWDDERSAFYVAVDARGNPILVEGFSAVAQQLALMIIVEIGEFPPDLNLGSKIYQILGSAGADSPYRAFIYKEVSSAVDKLKVLQASLNQLIELEDYEIVDRLNSVDVLYSTADIRNIEVIVSVITRDNEDRSLSVPVVLR